MPYVPFPTSPAPQIGDLHQPLQLSDPPLPGETEGPTFRWNGTGWEIRVNGSVQASELLLYRTSSAQDAIDAALQASIDTIISRLPAGAETVPAALLALKAEILGTVSASLDTFEEVAAALAGKSDTGHGHAIGDVTGLQAALDTKLVAADIAGKLDASGVSSFGASLIDDADAAAARTTLGLGTAASEASGAFAAATHTHVQSEVTGLETTLADKAPLSHTHDTRYYTKTEIDSKTSAGDFVGPYTGSDANHSNYPKGTVLLVAGPPPLSRNAAVAVYAVVGSEHTWAISTFNENGSSVALAGTWRARGAATADGGENPDTVAAPFLVERVA